MRRHQDPFWAQVPIASVEDRVEHSLGHKEGTHPFGDDDVDALHGDLDLFHLAMNQRDSVAKLVVGDHLSRRLVQQVTRVNAVHVFGTEPCTENRQDSG
eukprot:CAMPEP_0167805232 /NCGR_PEP_ID=MMETSP0111_2-20121227/21052_1 /TAXON_ID=91324 /ORGANISM="Lotharella globosa, Strain CCCM811" /LENGTH=98 /DNA_ID=CAMNT_0007702339 /DNA_START=302 /DNA_END=594 /DNA_ORIENTATION=-